MINSLTGFLVVCAVLALLAVYVVVAPLWRSRTDVDEANPDIDLYKDQLAEVERDLERGVLNEDEAERTRTEVARRLLLARSAARSETTEGPVKINKGLAAVLGLALVASAGWGYWTLGSPGFGDVPQAERIARADEARAERPNQLEAEDVLPERADSIEQFDEETRNLIMTRRAIAFEDPDNLEAWAILSQTEAAIGNFIAATRAQERVIALLGTDATEEDIVRLLDMMVAAVQGYVSPEAEVVAVRLMQMNPDSIAGHYYLGLLYAQHDRPDRAFPFWRHVVENGDPRSLHYDFASNQIEEVAARLGVDYVVPTRRGPSQEDIEAAQELAPEDRAAMIEGMVAQLSDRLATEGGPPQDWARLISSLAVLGELDQARAILAESELVFGGDVVAVERIRAAARAAGILE